MSVTEEHLRDCMKKRQELSALSTRYMEVTARALSPPSPSPVSGRHPPWTDKLERMVIKAEDIHEKMIDKTEELEDLKQTICEGIERMTDETGKDVLFYRYVCGWKWERITAKLGTNERFIFRVHQRALREFEKANEGF